MPLKISSYCSIRSVQPLAKIQAFDPLCEVQSDKASVEITSPFDGVVKQLLVQEGEIAKVGAGLCLIEVDEEVLEGVNPATVEPAEPVEPPQTSQSSSTEAQTVEPPAEPKAQDPRRLHPLDPAYTPTLGGSENVLAAPSVRHFARQNKVDLAKLMPGSGKGGRIEKRDIESYLAKPTDAPSTSPLPPTDLGKDVVVELGRTRHGMWKAMVKVCEICF